MAEEKLAVAVLGAGNIGGTLGKKWSVAGHQVCFGVNDPAGKNAWENFAEPNFSGIQADLFYCGPDGEAKPNVEQLISDVGLRPIYLGGSEQMGLLDSLTSLWFTLAFGQKKGRHLAFKVLGI